jgi:DNA-binding transcriptional ArsR family regulator
MKSKRRTNTARARLTRTSQSDGLGKVFGALSDPIRRAIVVRLTEGECSVSVLAQPFAVSAPAITKHLRVLEESGLLGRRKAGRVHYCRLRPEAIRNCTEWMQQLSMFWEQQFDSLEAYLDRS